MDIIKKDELIIDSFNKIQVSLTLSNDKKEKCNSFGHTLNVHGRLNAPKSSIYITIDVGSDGADATEARMHTVESLKWLEDLAPSIMAKVKELLEAEPVH